MQQGRCGTGLLLLLGCRCVLAAEWTWQPNVQFSAIHTDNINLVETDKDDELVYELTGGFVITAEGKHQTLNVKLDVQHLIYTESGADDDTHGAVSLDSKTDVIPDYFFLNLQREVGEKTLTAGERAYTDFLSLSQDTVDYETYEINPYFEHEFEGSNKVHVGYRKYASDYGEYPVYKYGAAFDSYTEEYNVKIDNSSSYDRFLWKLVANDSHYTTEDRPLGQSTDIFRDLNRRNGLLDLSFEVAKNVKAIFRSGVEDNQLNGDKRDNNGNYQAAGFGWNPNLRFEISSIHGERYSDSSLRWDMSNRSQLLIGYSDTSYGLVTGPTWRSSLKLKSRKFDATFKHESSIASDQINFLHQAGQIDDDTTALRIEPEIYEREYSGLLFESNGRYVQSKLHLFREDREYFINRQSNVEIRSIELMFIYRLSGRQYVSAEWLESRYDYQLLDIEDPTRGLELKWILKFNKKLDVEIFLREMEKEFGFYSALSTIPYPYDEIKEQRFGGRLRYEF